MRPEVMDAVLIAAMAAAAVDWLRHWSHWPSLLPSPALANVGLWDALITGAVVLVPTSIGGAIRMRDRARKAEQERIKKAEEAGYLKAQEEARTREARLALAAKDAEIAELRNRLEVVSDSLAECIKEGEQ